jgi:predicted TIM-barrel fold metal-dependent hydrolase
MAETSNLLFCAALIWPRAIANTVRDFGPERVLFGSGEPRDSLPAAIKRCERLGLSDTDRQAIFCDNARRVFRLP